MLAVATYNAYLVLHVVTAVVWLGGGLALTVLGTRIAKERDAARAVMFSRDVEWMSTRVFIPSSLLVLLFGFLMIHEGPPSFGDLWIQLALALFAVTFLTGALFLGPQSGKIGKLIEQFGEQSNEVQDQIRRVLLVARLDLLTLYSIVVVMVTKPSAEETLLFVIWAIVLALAAALVVLDYRRDAAGAPAVQ